MDYKQTVIGKKKLFLRLIENLNNYSDIIFLDETGFDNF